MIQSREHAQIFSSDIDRFANEVAMAVWNRIAELPQFRHLKPKDYPRLFETIQRILKLYHKSTKKIYFIVALIICSTIHALATDSLTLNPESHAYLTARPGPGPTDERTRL